MSRRRKPSQPLADWRSITDDREKYQAYLCSREWADKREAVRHRAGDKCERCGVLPMAACHHLTYARKYNENTDDLQAICQPCHDFTHGKSVFDPCTSLELTKYFLSCKSHPIRPIPADILFESEPKLSKRLTTILFLLARLEHEHLAFKPPCDLDNGVLLETMNFLCRLTEFGHKRSQWRIRIAREVTKTQYSAGCESFGFSSELLESEQSAKEPTI